MRPKVVDVSADDEFRETAISFGYDISSPWVDRYVEYEWDHIRHAIEIYAGSVKGRKALELGCNIGASSAVLAALGAEVVGIDINPRYVRLAELNLSRHGLANGVSFRHVPELPPLPFPDASFDLVCCNSVLEYVPITHLSGMMTEIGRVLRPGGLLLISGTSNRLWPREVHSRRWLVNYLPRRFDRFRKNGRSFQRGVFPWELTRPLPGFAPADADGCKYRDLHQRMGARGVKAWAVAAMTGVARILCTSPGRLAPSIMTVLRRGSVSTSLQYYGPTIAAMTAIA